MGAYYEAVYHAPVSKAFVVVGDKVVEVGNGSGSCAVEVDLGSVGFKKDVSDSFIFESSLIVQNSVSADVYEWVLSGINIFDGFDVFVVFKIDVLIWYKLPFLVPVNIFALLLLFGGLEEKFNDKRSLKKSLRNIAYYDSKINGFLDIKEIKDNCVIRKDNSVVAVLKVAPVNFAIMSDEEKEYTVSSYNQWLRGLNYPVQILSKSVPLDISKWISSLESKPEVLRHKAHFSVFKSWILEQIFSKGVRNRVFYIVIPIEAGFGEKGSLKQLGEAFVGKSFSSLSFDSVFFDKALKILDERVSHCSDTLKACGVGSRRLNGSELLQLYASYFTDRPDIRADVLTPFMDAVKDDSKEDIANENKEI